jgi:hypothetical protein
MTMPLALSDEQMDRLLTAASLLPVTSRDAFLNSVAGRVAGLPCIGMAEIEQAIAVVLGTYGIAGGHQAFARPKPRANNRSSTR